MDKDMRNETPKDFPPEQKFETHGGPPDKSWSKHPWHRRSIMDEDAFPAEDDSNPDDRRKVIRARKIATLGASVIFILGLAVAGELARSPDPEISNQQATQVMSELNAAENTGSYGLAEAIETEAAMSQAEISEEEKAELISQGEDSMKDQIFGDDEDQGISPYLTITGMTDKEKRDAGFVETDFLREAGLFLKDRGISTKRIIVEKEVECSLPKGMAFQGRLEKVDGKSFRFILFPNLPGQYIFMIEEDEKEVQPETLTTEDASEADNQSAGSQTQAASQAQYPLQVQPQSQTQEQADDYDARNISISSVPEELLNYMDNRYVFQYSLYNYLFSHGKKDIESAEVTDYSIDAETRQATIHLRLSDGTDLTAVYSKSGGSYTFS
ncbi:MAG: hypothetical protein SPG98_02775 [Porcincola intestinalis]|jgi:hypothetical protein|uniref:hypothetical protein n=1 Tax=Porcincola intestinalis TaxID=2606632 RepID=UPI002A908922|nr:hypothetical protein [Porcincola intestinalis]MDY5331675.1 hypothetical protein [Porcincola intestinalis]